MKKRVMIFAVILLAAAVAAFLLLRPGKFDAEIEKTIASIKPGNLTLAVYSDLHHDPSKKEPGALKPTMYCIEQIMEKCRVDAMWNLGDLINGHNTTKAEALAQIKTVTDAENRVTADVHRVIGNHDDNVQSTYASNTGYGPEEILSLAEMNAALENAESEVHNPLRPTDYYVDFPTIRVVCLSADGTTWQAETAEWLSTTALDTSKEVLVFSHIPTRPEWGFRNDVVNGESIEAALEHFISQGGVVIAHIHGHDHGDMIQQVISDDGKLLWHSVAIGCARFQYPTSNGTSNMVYWPRKEDDATAVLFDIVTIDQEKREVRFVRCGAGGDRMISYGR